MAHVLYGHPVRVRFSDTDTTGRVYFGSYVRWLDDALIDYLRTQGIEYVPAGGLRVDGKTHRHVFIIGEYHCRINHPSQLNDELLVDLYVAEQRPKVLRFAGRFRVPTRRDPVADAWISYVYVDLDRMRAIEIPPTLLARLVPSGTN